MMPYIKLFADSSATIDLLSDAEAGRLFKAVMHYANGQIDELPGQERLVFAMLKTQIDRDTASYQSFIDKQRLNGQKGGRPKNPSLLNENPNNPSLFEKTQKSQDKDKEEDKEKDIKENTPKGVQKKTVRFSPPTIEEVEVYCKERNNNVNPQRWFDFYSAKGWKIGNNPMRDWKAAVRTWEQRDDRPQQAQKKVSAQQYEQRDYTETELADISGNVILQALEAKYGGKTA